VPWDKTIFGAPKIKRQAGENVIQDALGTALPISDPMNRGVAPYRNYSASLSALGKVLHECSLILMY